MPIKIFIADQQPDKRSELFPLLKPYLKSGCYSDKQRIEQYGLSEQDFCLVDTVDQAQMCIVPGSVNSYAYAGRIKSLAEVVNRTIQKDRPLLLHMTGDYGVAFRPKEGCYVLRPNGNKSKLSERDLGIPIFIEDPLVKHRNGQWAARSYEDTPVVGFCGQADGSPIKRIADLLRIAYRNLLIILGVRKALKQPLIATTYLRAQLLSICERSNLSTDFIRRKKYRAGARSTAQKQRSTQEFYENIAASDYTICVRGGGNFSVRLYETLAMGRIPIYIDTDGLLPLAHTIPWHRHMVIIPYARRHQLADYVLKFHKELGPEGFQQIQQNNRNLWKDKLTLAGFFKHVTNQMLH